MQASVTPPSFDTQRAVEHLQASGFSSVQAVAITRTLVDTTANLATKADLAAVQAGIDHLKESVATLAAADGEIKGSVVEVREEVSQVRQEVGQVRQEVGQVREAIGHVKEAIGQVRIAVAQSQVSLMRMMLFVSFGIIGAIVGLLRWVLPQ
jgi:chromosome segregation ATPase